MLCPWWLYEILVQVVVECSTLKSNIKGFFICNTAILDKRLGYFGEGFCKPACVKTTKQSKNVPLLSTWTAIAFSQELFIHPRFNFKLKPQLNLFFTALFIHPRPSHNLGCHKLEQSKVVLNYEKNQVFFLSLIFIPCFHRNTLMLIFWCKLETNKEWPFQLDP